MKMVASKVLASCRTLVAVLAVGLGATACMSSSASESADPGPASCGQPGSVSPATPTVAVLGETGTATDYYANDLDMVIRGAGTMGARAMLSGVGSDATAPSLVANTVLTGDGANKLERDNNLACKQTLIRTGFSQALRDHPDPRPLDVFGALKTLEGNLAGTAKGAPVDVVLFTSLLNTAPPLDLSAPGALNDPTVGLNTLAAQRLMPDCTGWRVYAIGGDHQLRSPAGNVTSAGLREFWRQYYERCGGALVSWSSHLDAFPIAGGPIAQADTTQVPVRQEPGRVVAELAGDVLFDPGLADLRPEAGAQLDQVLRLANRAHGRIVVDGYTDVGGDEADNVGLSQRRSAEIQSWLVRNGVSPGRVEVRGHGSADPRFADPKTPAQHQANRRVEVTIFD